MGRPISTLLKILIYFRYHYYLLGELLQGLSPPPSRQQARPAFSARRPHANPVFYMRVAKISHHAIILFITAEVSRRRMLVDFIVTYDSRTSWLADG